MKDIKINILLNKMLYSKYLPLVITSLVYFVFFINVADMGIDATDYFYPEANSGKPLLDILKGRYESWTSRLLIEWLMFLVLRLPLIVWKIGSAIGFSAVLWSAWYIFFKKERSFISWIFCSFIVMCDIYKLSTSAGFVATTMNYLWPSAALFIAILPIKLIEEGKKLNPLLYLCSAPFAVYASNQETFAVVLFIISIVFCIKQAIVKKREYYYYILLIVSLVSIIFALSCPGNTLRFESEVNTWYPGYTELSFFEKTAIGIVTLFNYIAISNSAVFWVSSFIALLLIYTNTEEKIIYRIISLIPFLGTTFVVCAVIAKKITDRIIGKLPEIMGYKTVQKFISISNTFIVEGRFGGLAQGDHYHSIMQFILLAFICIILFLYLFCIYIIFRKTIKTLKLYLVIFLGAISQMVLAFSPTIYASAIRTAILLFLAISVAGTTLFSEYMVNKRMESTGTLSLVLVFMMTTIFLLAFQFIKL